jgi:nucleoside phosphorylase
MQRLSDIRNESRPRLFKADHDLLSAASAAEKSDWHRKLHRVNDGQPNVHFGTVLSGDKVIASSTMVANFLLENERLIGVEMEGAGVAAALARHPVPVPFLMIRGVVDYANDDKREQSRVWLTDACAATAAFSLAVIEWAHDTTRDPSDR